ncbi:MAG TPA: hypothetical protein VN258_16800 [Mobilitalea sp.]|nr:hypothetical protein [Mobilitalea sp.]
MKSTKAIFILAMLIFGSIGLFVKNINLSSGQLLLSPLLLKERLTVVKLLCILGAVAGMFCIVSNGGESGKNDLIGIVLLPYILMTQKIIDPISAFFYRF